MADAHNTKRLKRPLKFVPNMRRNVILIFAAAIAVEAVIVYMLDIVPIVYMVDETRSLNFKTISCDEDTKRVRGLMFKLYTELHNSTSPSSSAGQWVRRPDWTYVPSPNHLQCLDLERQGNCHDPNAWKMTTDKAKMSRHIALVHNAVINSPGILNASDPFVWQSNLPEYNVIPWVRRQEYRQRIGAILSNRTIYLVGDSLTRQWSQAIRCEIMHILGKSEEVANKTISFLAMQKGFETGLLKRYGYPFKKASEKDYVVINFGHHLGHKLGGDWPSKYHTILENVLAVDFGKIPDHHIFFRTTSVRHYLKNQGDWDTNSSVAGSGKPIMNASWSLYGGNKPEQPMQNLIAFNVFLDESKNRTFQILDTSPMMLARADATFDGSHFCLPGPMDYWSRMLYFRIEKNDNCMK